MLVGVQAFRFPLELLLHELYVEGHLPVEMTFLGANFDIATGIGALVVAGWGMKTQVPRWVLWAFYTMGMVLLVTIIGIAFASFPQPLGLFEVKNTVVTTFPFIWLPFVLVLAALFFHLVTFRKLWATRTSVLKEETDVDSLTGRRLEGV